MSHSRRLLACLVATLALAALSTPARGQIDATNVADLALKWDFPLTAGVTGTPVLANGLLYAASWNGFVYALDPDVPACMAGCPKFVQL